jgi:hypothetical protein
VKPCTILTILPKKGIDSSGICIIWFTPIQLMDLIHRFDLPEAQFKKVRMRTKERSVWQL